MRRALVLLALAACTQDRDVLSQTLLTCPTDLLASANQPCSFTETCVSTGSNACVTVTGSCTDDTLHVDSTANGCTPCDDDSACASNAALCGSNARCEACPPLDVCPIVDCPNGTVHLTRNGCEVCACAPAPTCAIDGSDSSGADGSASPVSGPSSSCTGSDATCYRGLDCASGCLPADPGCCTAECGAPGCANRIPTGCAMPCDQTTSVTCGSNGCIASHCECVGSAFHCTPECADTQPTCTVPVLASGAD